MNNRSQNEGEKGFKRLTVLSRCLLSNRMHTLSRKNYSTTRYGAVFLLLGRCQCACPDHESKQERTWDDTPLDEGRMSQRCSTGDYHTRDEALFVFAHPCPPSFFKRRNIRSLFRRLLASITSFLIRITSSASIVTNIHKRSNDVEVRHYTPFREQDWCPERCGLIKAANVKAQSWMLTSIFLPLEHPSYWHLAQNKIETVVFTFHPLLLSFATILMQGLLRTRSGKQHILIFRWTERTEQPPYKRA